MNADELRAAQAPIKARYREDPAAARVTMRATGIVATTDPTCRVETGLGPAVAGLHPAAGGDGDGSTLCSGDMLLQSLVACAGVTLKAVAIALGYSLQRANITAEAGMDFRGTLGVSKDVPVGIQEVRLNFELEGPISEPDAEKLIALTERYCVVAQTLKHPPIVNLTHRRDS